MPEKIQSAYVPAGPWSVILLHPAAVRQPRLLRENYDKSGRIDTTYPQPFASAYFFIKERKRIIGVARFQNSYLLDFRPLWIS